MSTQTSKIISLVVLGVLVVACVGNPFINAPTAAPTTIATTTTITPPIAVSPTAPDAPAPAVQPTAPGALTPVPTPRIVVQTTNGTVEWVDFNSTSVTLAKTTAHFEIGRLSNTIGKTAYAITAERGEVYAIDARGVHRLDFIPGALYGFAVTPGNGGGTERLAWGTALLGKNSTAEIVISAPDGTDRKNILKESFTGEPRTLLPMQWSPDGKKLYYGKDPVGIGGYILFGGTSSLWSLNLSDNKPTELIKEGSIGGMLCIDSVSPNGQWAASHCTQKYIRIISLSDPARSVRVSPPGDLPKFNQLGSAEFNPSSTRIAYAIAKGEPDNEQGWVLVSDRLSGGSRVVAESQPNEYLTVLGWLNTDTILVQSHAQKPAVWLVNSDGSNITKLTDGNFLALLPK